MAFDIEKIAVLDFGSQYSQLIARRIRECSVFSKILPFNISVEKLRAENPSGIILSGGPASVYNPNAPKCDPEILKLGIPVLGICYGEQLIIQTFGGKVDKCDAREYGKADLEVKENDVLFEGFGNRQQVWMSHGDKVKELPSGFRTIAVTGSTEYAAIVNSSMKIYGIQFHPEVVHTPRGKFIIENFCRKICGCSGSWTMKSFIDTCIEDIRKQVGDKSVILGLSGGVDSSVAAALLHKAIGEQLTCIFVNNGLLRKGESERVQELYGRNFKINLKYVDATEKFITKLENVEDPERKRKIIGHEFIEVFDEAAKEIKDVAFLAQGTTYPDVIESVPIDGNPSAMIKSHHNVGGLPEKMKLKLVEPLAKLFKDEVREVGRCLGLPDEIILRQPFPGPGLGVRIIGKVTMEAVKVLQEADSIVVDEMKKADPRKHFTVGIRDDVTNLSIDYHPPDI